MTVIEVWPDQDRLSESGHAETILTNARIVTGSDCFSGTVRIKNGVIADISSGTTAAANAVDVAGDFLIPGIVDVHTDHLEKHVLPRPGMTWNPVSAAIAYDAQIIAAGTTTVFDSLTVGAGANPERQRLLPLMLDGIREARAHGALRAEHFLHLRCDAEEPNLLDIVPQYLDRPDVRFVTIMDDGPHRNLERFRSIHTHKGRSAAEIETMIAAKGASSDCNQVNRTRLLAMCRERNIACASHDDTTAAHIEEAVAAGSNIAEFPISMEAARAARAASMTAIVGAPNIVAGRSHIGNVSVRELAEHRLFDIICSDYIPASLLRAIWYLPTMPNGPSLPEAVAMGTRNPAQTFGLSDRGEIAIGKRADLVRVSDIDGPIVRSVWRRGQRML
ncbi:alpha-D-ribose 1-methylphosphonate 5-triphosphate diphosphatase [Agrobacterium tumefaciens]|uniref:alpha-D-ribose 1-methylphosphonate 5-triphosphate diphosphatase n=1 Tax=Agrobacterium tumefaciens TaxID=358 RepID=UPI00157457EC|nr:alpha-D-ribose 1-methylphosphonate 5-triphosphate diphosphatase [Agrobacterium tumefaciens]NTE66139.1 alpha-D-ribose 1-methylphosphonate 5-triphosphate diphosphatase [Agrobacterium tumefaciens]